MCLRLLANKIFEFFHYDATVSNAVIGIEIIVIVAREASVTYA
jgi:hypothetical protein